MVYDIKVSCNWVVLKAFAATQHASNESKEQRVLFTKIPHSRTTGVDMVQTCSIFRSFWYIFHATSKHEHEIVHKIWNFQQFGETFMKKIEHFYWQTIFVRGALSKSWAKSTLIDYISAQTSYGNNVKTSNVICMLLGERKKNLFFNALDHHVVLDKSEDLKILVDKFHVFFVLSTI